MYENFKVLALSVWLYLKNYEVRLNTKCVAVGYCFY